ncbi:MAG: Do family serine endopeptidase, partial [Phycisphaerales bacterium]|nr:Do family serine endopeptidase [Phycisphaerales bacterium]
MSDRSTKTVSRNAFSAGVLGLALATPMLTNAVLADDKATEAAIARAMDLSLAFEHVAKTVSPAVVHITANKGGDEVRSPQRGQRGRQRQPQRSPFNDPNFDEMFRRFFGDQGQGDGNMRQQTPRMTSFGSGVLVTKDGYILTNNHVVEGASLVTVATEGSQKYTAKIVGTDPQTDIAVLKIEGDTFPTAEIGDSDNLKVGEWVVAIGNPFELNQTVTAGIVSAKGRSQRGGSMNDVTFQDFIQTDAAINPGNSGGPLLNLHGQIVGINSAILTRTGGSIGIGFAIPANMAKNVMDQLISSGKVERGFLGIQPQDLNDDLAKSFNYGGGSGVLVSDVTSDTPAAQAGVKAGDIITKINGKPPTNADNLRNTIASMGPGKKVDLEIFRDGKAQSISATLGKRPDQLAANADGDGDADANADATTDDKLGLTVQTLTADVAQKLGDRRAKEGVVVTDVQPDG